MEDKVASLHKNFGRVCHSSTGSVKICYSESSNTSMEDNNLVSHLSAHTHTHMHTHKQTHTHTHAHTQTHTHTLASFPGSPLIPTKNRKGGGEPGIDSHVMPWHDVTAIIA